MKGASILMNCLYISISLVIEKITFSRNIVGLSLDTKKNRVRIVSLYFEMWVCLDTILGQKKSLSTL